MSQIVQAAFDLGGVTLPLSDIHPIRQVKPTDHAFGKYRSMLASIREVGVIEPLIVHPQKGTKGTYLLLDGHMRLKALLELKRTEAFCLIAKDDDAFTYNDKVNRLSLIQEHAMIMRAIELGVSAEQIAKALDLDVARIKASLNLLDGIHPEAVDLLKDKPITAAALRCFKKAKAVRQIDMAQLAVSSNSPSTVIIISRFDLALVISESVTLPNRRTAALPGPAPSSSPHPVDRVDSLSASAQAIFAPQFRQLAKGCGPSPVTRTTLHAYSLFAFLAGTSLKEVLVDLAIGSAPPNFSAEGPKCVSSRRLLFYKARIEKFMAEHPGCTRTQICDAANHAVDLVRNADPDWFEHHMPESLSQKPGRHGDRNWNNRDEKLCALITDFVAKNGPTLFRSFRDALIKLNKHKGLFCKAHGRLPKAHALLEALIEAKQAAA